jgi:lantibiotic modifying enzyme
VKPHLKKRLDFLLKNPNLGTSLDSKGNEKTAHPDMYTGLGGNIVMYHRLYKATGNKVYHDQAMSWLAHCLELLKSEKERTNSFFMSGAGLYTMAALLEPENPSHVKKVL